MIVWNYLIHYGIPRKSGRYAWGSGENPYHHGQSAPWRVRRNIKKYDKLKSKLDKNQSEQDKYNAKLNGYFKSRAQSKASKAEEKAASLEKRVYKANKKLANGKELSRRQKRALDKYDKYNDRADKYNAQTAKERAKIKSLETDEKRIIDKINKIDDKLLKLHHKEIEKQQIKRGKEIFNQYKGKFSDRYPWDGTWSRGTRPDIENKAKAYASFEKDGRSKTFIENALGIKIQKDGWYLKEKAPKSKNQQKFEKTLSELNKQKYNDGDLKNVNKKYKKPSFSNFKDGLNEYEKIMDDIDKAEEQARKYAKLNNRKKAEYYWKKAYAYDNISLEYMDRLNELYKKKK